MKTHLLYRAVKNTERRWQEDANRGKKTAVKAIRQGLKGRKGGAARYR
jgi:hypothetical protein